MVPSVMLSLFLEFIFKAYNLHRPQLCHTAARHFELSFHCRKDECHELDAVNKLNELASALWDNVVSETFIEEYW